jgi:hypothetical protein
MRFFPLLPLSVLQRRNIFFSFILPFSEFGMLKRTNFRASYAFETALGV